jgi:hypothetical protein
MMQGAHVSRPRYSPALIALLLWAGMARAREPEPGFDALVAALDGEDAVARFLAEEKLVAAGDRALPALARVAASPGYSPGRRYAINVLAHIGGPEAIRILLRILEGEPDVMARAWVCRHFGRMGVREAVPVIGKWLLTIRGKPMDFGGGDRYGNPRVATKSYAWALHAHALREIGSEEAIPLLETMLEKPHGGRGGRQVTRAYGDALAELKREAAFWAAVRRVPGLDAHAKLLFDWSRGDTLARIRLYRDKITRSGLEGRWVLEGLGRHHDEPVRRAAAALLQAYDRLGHRP